MLKYSLCSVVCSGCIKLNFQSGRFGRRSVVYMGIHNRELAANKPVGWELAVVPEADLLPEVPASVLRRAFHHLNSNERDGVLRQRLLPVAWLPNMTLYADGNERPNIRHSASRRKVIARISPVAFSDAVRRWLGPGLTEKACNELKQNQPLFSASQRLSTQQQMWALIVTFGIVLLGPLMPVAYFVDAGCFVLTTIFACMVWLRLLAITERASPSRFKAEMNDAALPVYSVLVPVFRETRVLTQLIGALQRLNYPRAKLDIKLILEESDEPMIRKVASMKLPSHFEVIVVPRSNPQTKPKALNYALAFARGELLTIYDAEDIPEPMQLRKAVAGFVQFPPDVACLQAELTFFNPNESWLARQFTLEYATLFTLVLPALAKNKMPLPLGGTSNHFRVDVLRRIGGWDPYNVTEDADIGIRLARHGFRAMTFDSITYEEANTELRNWLHQRARWMKGFLQSWLVHMRQPLLLLREVGPAGFLLVQAMLIGVVLSSTLYPIFLGLVAFQFILDILGSQQPALWLVTLRGSYLGFLVLGTVITMLSGLLALRRKHYFGWWGTLITMPIYWMLASLAGWMAIWQFIHAPFKWNKTRHGLSRFQREV